MVVHTWNNRDYEDDTILQPGYYVSYCKSPLAMAGIYDFEEGGVMERSYSRLKDLEWSAAVTEVYTQ